MTSDKQIIAEPVWTLVANIVHDRPYGHGGQESRIGTKHFRPGAKVYIIDWYAGMCEYITVVGLARKQKRLIKVVIRANWVEDLRVKLCYNPAALKKMYQHFDYFPRFNHLTKEFAETMLKVISQWQEDMRAK